MTIKRARELLGKEAMNKTDEEINRIIINESKLCDVLLQVFEQYLTSHKQSIYNGARVC